MEERNPPPPLPRVSLTLSKQFTFSVGYTIFPQRAQFGFIAAILRGFRRVGGAAELPPAAAAAASEAPPAPPRP